MLHAIYQRNWPGGSGGEVVGMVFSSPEPKAPGELLVWEASVVRPSTLSNDFSSETTGPNVTKFHM